MFSSGLLKRISLHLDLTDFSLGLGCDFPDYNLNTSATSGVKDLFDLKIQNIVVKIVKSFDENTPLRSKLLFGSDEEILKNFSLNFAVQARLGALLESLDVKTTFVYKNFLQFNIDSVRHPVQTASIGSAVSIPFKIHSEVKAEELVSYLVLSIPLYDPLHRSHVIAEINKVFSIEGAEKKPVRLATVIVPINSEKNISMILPLVELFPSLWSKGLQSANAYIDFSDVSNCSLSFEKEYKQVSINRSLPIGRYYANIRDLLSFEENHRTFEKTLQSAFNGLKLLDDSFVKELTEKFNQLSKYAETNQKSSAEALVNDLDQQFKQDAKALFDTLTLHIRNMHAMKQISLVHTLSESYAKIFLALLSDKQKLELEQKPLDQLSSVQKWAKKFGDLASLSSSYIEQKDKYLLNPFVLGVLEGVFNIQAQEDSVIFPNEYLSSLEKSKNKG